MTHHPRLQKIPTYTCDMCHRTAIWQLTNTGGQVTGYYCGVHGRLALEEYREAMGV